jgi:hypothetical protein
MYDSISFHDNLIHTSIFRNNCPVKCHFQRPPNQEISPIEFFKHFSHVYGNRSYTVGAPFLGHLYVLNSYSLRDDNISTNVILIERFS